MPLICHILRLCHLPLEEGLWTGGASPSPTGFKKVLMVWGRKPFGAPARIRTGSVGSAKPGAVLEPHQRQFLQTQGQVAREVSRKATPFLRAGNDAQSLRSASSVTGDRGKGEYGRISAHPEPSPGDSLVTFSSLRKSLAAGAAKFSPHFLKGTEKRRRGQAPALPRICALTCPLIRPLRGHLPPGGRLSIFVRPSPYNKTHSLTTKERRTHYGKQSHRPHQRGDPA